MNSLLIINKSDVHSNVLKLTNNEGVNVVYDGVGKDTFDISLKC